MTIGLSFLIPIAALIVGCAAAAVTSPRASTRSILQHIAAGVILAAATLELLPAVREESPLVAIAGFAIGLVLMLALDLIAKRMEALTAARGVTGLVLVIGLDVAIDGLVMGMGFAAGERTGLLLAIAISLEFAFLGLSVGASLQHNARRIAVVALALSAINLVAAIAGYISLGGVPEFVRGIAFAVGIVALLYLVLEELLVEAHEERETAWTTSAFFVGFLVYLLIIEVI